MAITQKVIKEQIKSSEKMVSETADELDKKLREIKRTRDESTNIDPQKDEALIEKIDEYNGLHQTLQYYNGHLDAYKWTLEKMRSISRQRRSKENEK